MDTTQNQLKHKKILMCSNLISYTYNFRREIIEMFLSEGHSVVVVADNDDDDKSQKLIQMGCSFFNVPFDGKSINVMSELILLVTYWKIFRKEKPDIVFTFTIKPTLYGGLVAGLKKQKFVPMITGLGELEKKGKLQTLLLLMHKIVIPKAAIVFFQNADNKAFFMQHQIKFKKAQILPGSGINLEEHNFVEYPIPENCIKLAFVGRLTRAKGIQEVLDVAERIHSERLPIEVHIAGKCDEEFCARVTKLQKEGIIQYYGLLSDTSNIYNIIHCLLLPTYHPEGISNVLLEAGACGRPAICTERTGCKEVVKDGVNGMYCEAQNADALYQVIKEFLFLSNFEKAEMGYNARKIVEEKFSRKKICTAYKEISEVDSNSYHRRFIRV